MISMPLEKSRGFCGWAEEEHCTNMGQDNLCNLYVLGRKLPIPSQVIDDFRHTARNDEPLRSGRGHWLAVS